MKLKPSDLQNVLELRMKGHDLPSICKLTGFSEPVVFACHTKLINDGSLACRTKAVENPETKKLDLTMEWYVPEKTAPVKSKIASIIESCKTLKKFPLQNPLKKNTTPAPSDSEVEKHD